MGLLKCYVSAPFSEDGTVRKAIAAAIEDAGLRAVQSEYGAAISGVAAAQALIEDVNCVVADVTHGNPNVAYEVGLAHGLRKPVLLVSQEFDLVPAALRESLILRYEVNDLQSLQAALSAWLARITALGTSR